MKFLVSVAVVLMSASVFAGGLADTKLKKEWADDIAEINGRTEGKCGFKVAVDMDASFLAAKARFDKENKTITSGCTSTLEAVQSLCEYDADAKAALKKSVKKIVCKPAPKAEDVNAKLASGTITVTYGEKAIDVQGHTKEQIQSQL